MPKFESLNDALDALADLGEDLCADAQDDIKVAATVETLDDYKQNLTSAARHLRNLAAALEALAARI